MARSRKPRRTAHIAHIVASLEEQNRVLMMLVVRCENLLQLQPGGVLERDKFRADLDAVRAAFWPDEEEEA